MRYSASEKLEIIRLVEGSHLSARLTLAKLGIPRTTFYRWYGRYLQRGEAGLKDQSPKPKHVWNRIPDEVRRKVVKLDATLLHSELAIIEGQLFEIIARQARLKAERDGDVEITYGDELRKLATSNDDVKDLIEGQTRLFTARQVSLAEEISQLEERVKQVLNQIKGTEVQLTSVKRQRALILHDLLGQEELLGQGLTQAAQVSTLQREEASLSGRIGELEAIIAQAHGQIAEIEISILRLKSAIREEAITTLRDLQYSELGLTATAAVITRAHITT